MGDEPEEKIVVVDYDKLDEDTGFKAVELDIWKAYEANVLAKPEDDRPDIDAWVDEVAEEKKYDRKRVKFVATMGIYAGPRDTFNQRTGSGKAYYGNGDLYDGEFLDGKKHGQGQYIFKKQGKSECDKLVEKAFKAKPSDESTEAFVDRIATHLKIGAEIVRTMLEFGYYPCYHGDYIRGLRVGQGLMKHQDGSVHKGDWANNKPHGQGMRYYLNGDVYSGQWSEGLKHGYGTYRFANMAGEYRGEWQKGQFAQGQWIQNDGTYFEGTFEKKKGRPMDDQGVMHFANLNVAMDGVYKKNRWAPLSAMRISDEAPAQDETWNA